MARGTDRRLVPHPSNRKVILTKYQNNDIKNRCNHIVKVILNFNIQTNIEYNNNNKKIFLHQINSIVKLLFIKSSQMLKANNDGKEITFRFNSLQVLSKTPTLLSLEELVEIEKQSSEDELSEQELELTPIATSFHSGCLIHAPYNQLIIVGGCFDEDDEWYEEESCTNEVMSFNYMENKWKLLFSRVLNDDESTSTTVEESDTNNVQEQISHINISSDEQYLERIVQSPIIQQSSSTAERRSNTPPRIWGHSCSYSPLTRSLYVFGGINYHDEYNEHLFSFSLDRREWKKIDAQKDSSMEELPCGRQGHRTVYIPSIHKMVLFGGFSSSHLDDFCEFDVRNNTWSRVEEDPAFLMNRPSCREVFSMIYAENRNSIIIFGGKTEDERFVIYLIINF